MNIVSKFDRGGAWTRGRKTEGVSGNWCIVTITTRGGIKPITLKRKNKRETDVNGKSEWERERTSIAVLVIYYDCRSIYFMLAK